MSAASAAMRRRELLRAGTALAAAPVLNACATAPAPAAAPRTDASPKVTAIDMHNHVYPAGTEPRHGHGGPEAALALSLNEELTRSGFRAVCASFVLDFAANERPGDARANLLRWFDAVDQGLSKGHISRALSARDLEATDAKPMLIQSVEGAYFIEGELSRIAEVQQRGLRHLQLLHEKDDMVSPLGDTNTGAAHLGGLSAFGAEVVKECNRLGVLVDLAHASHETVLGVLRVASQPPIVSHTNLDTWTGKNPRLAQMMKPRLISKEHAKVVADAGGVVGVWTHLTESLADLVQSLKAMVDAIGVEHVGVGTDTDLLSPRVGQGTNRAWPGFERGFFPALAEEMSRQGFTSNEVASIAGGNYLRVFARCTAAPV